MWPLLGLGAGLLKFGFDKNAESKDRELQAAKDQYSPWTGMHGDAVKRASLVGDAMTGGLAGMGYDQALQNQQSANSLSEAMKNYYNSKAAVPGASVGPDSGGWHLMDRGWLGA